ncbi:MAG: 5'-nucleotidase C-terminal domain-containing protein, partial [Desulfotomaculaceae bacterium]
MLIYKKFLKFSAITLLMFAFVLVMPCITAFAASGDKVFDIIEITDFHGTLEDTKGCPVAAVMAQNIKDIVNGNSGRALIVSCGDNYQGSVLSNMLRGVPVMSAFNDIGVGVSGLGNHDFDWGLDTVTEPGIANYPIICANLLYKGTNERVFDPYKIFEKDGVKIAVVGAVTEELTNIVLADYVKDYNVGSIVDNVEQAANDARAKGAQIVIALIHAGDNRNIKTAPVFDVANQLGGAGGVVDAVLGGGSHDLVNTTAANGTLVAIAGSYGKGFINMKITRHTDGTLAFNTSYIDGDTASTVFPHGYKALSPVIDQAINNIVNEAKTQVGPVANQKLGEADTDMTIAMADSPWGESLAGNWVCDVVKAKVNADFAFINKGAMRIDIPRGDITMGTMYTFMPFDNTITTANLTGAQIKTLLEQAVDEGGKGAQAAGLKFVYDPGAPSGARIVSISKSDGTPVNMTDNSKTYKVATNDFMSTGGDGFDIYKTVTSINTNIPVRETLAQNIQQAGHITAQVQGRIKKIESAGLTAGIGIGLRLNNQDVVFDVPPRMENGQFFVPLRPLLEAMGANVVWDGDTKTAVACLPGVTLVVADGAKFAGVNGSDLSLAAAAEINNGRLIVPLQIILEATG